MRGAKTARRASLGRCNNERVQLACPSSLFRVTFCEQTLSLFLTCCKPAAQLHKVQRQWTVTRALCHNLLNVGKRKQVVHCRARLAVRTRNDALLLLRRTKKITVVDLVLNIRGQTVVVAPTPAWQRVLFHTTAASLLLHSSRVRLPHLLDDS